VRAVRTKPDPCVLQQHDEEARACGCFHSLSRAICALVVVWDSCLSLCSFLPRSGAAPDPLVFSRPRGTALRIFSWRWQPAILLKVTLQIRNCRRRKILPFVCRASKLGWCVSFGLLATIPVATQDSSDSS
jgi:hypothetical protein